MCCMLLVVVVVAVVLLLLCPPPPPPPLLLIRSILLPLLPLLHPASPSPSSRVIFVSFPYRHVTADVDAYAYVDDDEDDVELDGELDDAFMQATAADPPPKKRILFTHLQAIARCMQHHTRQTAVASHSAEWCILHVSQPRLPVWVCPSPHASVQSASAIAVSVWSCIDLDDAPDVQRQIRVTAAVTRRRTTRRE